MITRELIYAEIEKLGEDNLDDLYEVIKHFVQAKATSQNTGILSKLKQIKIDAPADFAANLDLYLSGEKQLGDRENLP